jgi:curli production assembly/transport component CsgE
MQLSCRLAVLLLVAACPCAVHADGWGIVTNQAITVAGHEFCQYFIAAWLDKPDSDRYTIAIRERPSARWGSQVWVEFGSRRVVRAQLPPARAELKSLGENAAESAYQAIRDIERQRTLIRDADLAPDEF